MFLQNLSEKGTGKLILSREGDKDYIYCNTYVYFTYIWVYKRMALITIKIRLGSKKISLSHTSCRSFQIAVCIKAIQLISKLKHLQLWILSNGMLFFCSLIFKSFKQHCSQAPLLLLYCITYTAIAVCCVQLIYIRLKQGGKLWLLAVPCWRYHFTSVEMMKPGK